MSIKVTAVGSGDELDRVSLEDGVLVYVTGSARGMFEAKRNLNLDDAGVYALMSDWSNGYVKTKLDDTEPDAPE